MGGLAGHWRLVAMVEHDPAGTPRDGPLGARPRGSLYYGEDGYMSVHLMRDPAEGAGYIGYAGTWAPSPDGGRVTHTVAVSSDPSWAGGDQHRDVDLDGDRLVLTRHDTIDGTPFRATLTWLRS
ncbi:lipocalin-like domain-containing protein [Actinomadura flavalba]|uniref:lipocalin-like domain-containing protein n=1 Tax=Actinomadura flavalba TaxID=1120938 RepID=UPI0003706636|nr:lipocalin-like domain-containing protein [Actinomadura flavalba]